MVFLVSFARKRAVAMTRLPQFACRGGNTNRVSLQTENV